MIEPRRVRIPEASEPCRCPACHREIYNRRKTRCEFCDAPIPEELQLSRAEIGAINVELAEMELRRQQDKEREEEEREKQRRSAAGAA